MAPNRRQAIIWSNADPIHWCIYAALGGDKLKHKLKRRIHYHYIYNCHLLQFTFFKTKYTRHIRNFAEVHLQNQGIFLLFCLFLTIQLYFKVWVLYISSVILFWMGSTEDISAYILNWCYSYDLCSNRNVMYDCMLCFLSFYLYLIQISWFIQKSVNEIYWLFHDLSRTFLSRKSGIMLEKGTKRTQIDTASLGLCHIYTLYYDQSMNKTYVEAWKVCKIFADNLIATEYPFKDPCLNTWYQYSYTKNIKLLKIDIIQWLSLIFNDFSRQSAIFPGQHQIPWLFKASLKFHDFSRLVWTMYLYQLRTWT